MADSMILPQLPAILAGVRPPLAALAVAGLAALALRRADRWAAVPLAAGAAAGWAALLLPGVSAAAGRAVLWPRTLPDHLLLPVVVVAGAAVMVPRLPERGSGWTAGALAVLLGWWLAGSPAARPEFWRAWAVVAGVAWVLGRGLAVRPVGAVASALALWGGFLAVGASPVWPLAALVLVAASLPMLLKPAASPLPGALAGLLLAALMGAASLAAGRLPRIRPGAMDLACLAGLVAPIMAACLGPALARISVRTSVSSAGLSALAGAALSAGAAWAAARLLHLGMPTQ